MDLIIVLPVYNDWESLTHLMEQALNAVSEVCQTVHFIVVNDGSTALATPPQLPPLAHLHVVNLSTNYGHQRAIVLGLCYVNEELEHRADRVIVMDADGEDRPEDIPRLLHAADADTIVFAGRARRSERRSFKIGYWWYRQCFRLVSGERIRFGNFSCVPLGLLPRIIHNADFWNHYSAAILKASLPHRVIATDRGRRYAGTSHMNFSSLILHGMSAYSLYTDRVVIKLFGLLGGILILMLIGLGGIVYFRYFTELAIPGWASILFATIFNIVVTVSAISLLVLLQQLNRRSLRPEPPVGFYRNLILSVDRYPHLV